MAISYIGVSNLIATNGSAPGAITPAAATAVNDLLLFFHYSRCNSVGATEERVSVPNGFTEIVNAPLQSFGLICVGWRIRKTGDTSYTSTVTGHTSGTTGDTILQWIETYRGVYTNIPVRFPSSGSSFLGGSQLPLRVQKPSANNGNRVAPLDMLIVFAGRMENISGQTTLTGDNLTWTARTRNDTTQGADAGAVTQNGYNQSGTVQTITGSYDIQTTGTGTGYNAYAAFVLIDDSAFAINISESVTASDSSSGVLSNSIPVSISESITPTDSTLIEQYLEQVYPAIQGTVTTGVNGSNSTSAPFTVPTGVVAGELIVTFMSTDGYVSATYPSGWQGVFGYDDQYRNYGTPTQIVLYKTADGSEGGQTYTVTLSGSEQSSWVCARYQVGTAFFFEFNESDSFSQSSFSSTAFYSFSPFWPNGQFGDNYTPILSYNNDSTPPYASDRYGTLLAVRSGDGSTQPTEPYVGYSLVGQATGGGTGASTYVVQKYSYPLSSDYIGSWGAAVNGINATQGGFVLFRPSGITISKIQWYTGVFNDYVPDPTPVTPTLDENNKYTRLAAFSFVANSTAPLRKIILQVGASQSPVFASTIRYDLYAGTGSVGNVTPTGSVLASTNNYGGSTGYLYKEFFFSNPATLTSGNSYVIVPVITLHSSQTTHVLGGYYPSSTSTYPDGNTSEFNGTSWSVSTKRMPAYWLFYEALPSVEELASATDSCSATEQLNTSITESTTATDTQDETLSTSSSLTESATANDSQTVGIVFLVSITESATATDTQDRTLTASVSLTESTSSTDSQSATNIRVVSLTESTSSTESQTRFVDASRSITESTSATETQSGGLQAIVNITEATVATDSLSGNNSISRSLTESTTATDSASYAFGASGSVTESVSSVDSSSAIWSGTLSLSDGTTATDSQTYVRTVNQSISETATATDSVSEDLTTAASLSETVVAVDSANRFVSASRSITETVTGADSADRTLSTSGSVTDTVSSTDSASAAWSGTLSLSDGTTATDSRTVLRSAFGSVTETATATDLAEEDTSTSATISESVSAVDSVSATQTFALSVTESVSSSDSQTVQRTAFGSVTEAATATDLAEEDTSTTASITESVSATDSSAYALNVSRSISESGTATDSVSSVQTFVVSITETGSALDSASVSVSTNASVSETTTATDSQAYVRTVNQSLSEPATGSDSITAIRIVNQSVSEPANATETSDGSTSEVVSEDAAATDIQTGVILASRSVSESASASSLEEEDSILIVSINESTSPDDSALGYAIYVTTLNEATQSVDSTECSYNASVDLNEASSPTDSASTIFYSFIYVFEPGLALDQTDTEAQFITSIEETTIPADVAERNFIISSSILDQANSTDSLTIGYVKMGIITDSLTTTDYSVGALVKKRRFRTFTTHIIENDGYIGSHNIGS